jgi:DNA modification methylase
MVPMSSEAPKRLSFRSGSRRSVRKALAKFTELRGISTLRPFTGNARTHSAQQIEQLAASIKEFGFTVPILIDEAGTILAGHARLEAAKRLGLRFVPTLSIKHLSPAQKRAYVIADNRLAEKAGWDDDALAFHFEGLVDTGFNVELTGFSTAEIDLRIDALEDPGADSADHVPDLDPAQPAVSRPGDLWRLGAHRLLCADATQPCAYDQLLAGARAQMVFTDPPYNVPIKGHAGGSGRIQHREFTMATGEMSPAQYTTFLSSVFANLTAYASDGAIHFICMDWRHMGEILEAGRQRYNELKNLAVWTKDNAGMGSFYRSQHELVFIFKSGRRKHINNFGLGEGGRYRTNVWRYPGVNTFKPGRLEELALHPTVKPVALVADAMRDCSKRGGLILDPFLGSGTTLIAAERTGRRAYGLELDPLYVDGAIRRWEEHTGQRARHAASGLTLTALAAKRAPALAPQSDTPKKARRHGR